MGNSRRWGRLMEWIRHLQDINKDITLKDLAEKVNRIKDGAVLYDAEEVERAVDQAFIVRDEELMAILNVLVSKYYCNCTKARVGKVGKDVRETCSAITKLFKEREDDVTSDILRMENKKLGGCLETILKTIKSCKTAKYYDMADFKEKMLELIGESIPSQPYKENTFGHGFDAGYNQAKADLRKKLEERKDD